MIRLDSCKSRRIAGLQEKGFIQLIHRGKKFMRDVGKVKLTINPQKKTLDKIWNWLSISVAPSLKLFEEIGKLDNQDYIGLLVEQGIMNDSQRKIL